MKISKKRSNPTSLLKKKIRELQSKKKEHIIYGEYVRPTLTVEGGA